MISILSLVTSVKDYVEVVHQLIDAESASKAAAHGYNDFGYTDFGPMMTYALLELKTIFYNFISFNWLKNVWNLPLLNPDISSSMISEISILGGSFKNFFDLTTLDPSYGNTNLVLTSFQKFVIGALNSLFLWLPTSTTHFITLRRFVMQGVNAGYIAGLGNLAGSILWITCIIFGCRFIVIPWLSLDIFRYVLGFLILVKYMWDSYNEEKTVLEDLQKQKIFLVNFLLALTEQTSIYPFISNLSIGTEGSILESFPVNNSVEFFLVHGSYIAGLTIGSLSLLQFTCWFVQRNGLKIYMGFVGSLKLSEGVYSRALNFTFLYLTMFCAISSIPYYGLDYTLTRPLGFVSEDRIIDQKMSIETSFLKTKASDRNTRRDRGRHGRRERWKRRIRKYRTFDVSLYDRGVYDLFTIEDLNYGFDKFWLRRKMRNHRVRYRFFPQGAMRSFKKQLSKPRLDSYSGPRKEFFRILYEQVHLPIFHQKQSQMNPFSRNAVNLPFIENADLISKKEQIINQNQTIGQSSLQDVQTQSMIRKFVRKTDTRIKRSEIKNRADLLKDNNSPIYSKIWKETFSKLDRESSSEMNSSQIQFKGFFKNAYKDPLQKANIANINNKFVPAYLPKVNSFGGLGINIKKENSKENLSKKDQEILNYRSMLLGKQQNSKINQFNSQTVLHPIKFYLQKEQAFERKLRYYTPTVFRKFSAGNQAPYFRVMMKRYFYSYKPTLRWERTMRQATFRKAMRKTKRIPRKIQFNQASNNAILGLETTQTPKFDDENFSNLDRMQKPTSNYSVLGKRVSRYRSQIYKDVLQNWYYSAPNRFLLKFDIDSFIRRQPKNHFLTKDEEKLLHLRRFLLSEHYNTLRWYTSMEHYRAMKTKIGGTKSFASRAYNQQFQGTFKKIRHLFAITPSQSTGGEQNNLSVLKFDQPLFNESINNRSAKLQENFILHEELRNQTPNLSTTPDIVEQTFNSIGSSIDKSKSLKDKAIRDFSNQNDYSEMTRLLYQNSNPQNLITKQNYDLKDLLENGTSQSNVQFVTDLKQFVLEKKNFKEDLYLKLLTNWKKKVTNKKAVKIYISQRLPQTVKRTKRKRARLKRRIASLKTVLPFLYATFEAAGESAKTNAERPEEIVYKEKTKVRTGFQKALRDGISNVTTSQAQFTTLDKKSLFLKEKFDAAVLLKKQKNLQNSMNALVQIVPDNTKAQQYNLKANALQIKTYKEKIFNFLNIFRSRSPQRMKTLKKKTTAKQKQKRLRKQLKLKGVPLQIKNTSPSSLRSDNTSSSKFGRFELLSSNPNLNEIEFLSDDQEIYGIAALKVDTNNAVEIQQNVFQLKEKNTFFSKVPFSNLVKKTYNNLILGKGGQWKMAKHNPRRARLFKRRGVYKKFNLRKMYNVDTMKPYYSNGINEDSFELINRFMLKWDQQGNTFDANSRTDKSNEFSRKTLKFRPSLRRKNNIGKDRRQDNAMNFLNYKKNRDKMIVRVKLLKRKSLRVKYKSEFESWWFRQFLPNLKAQTYQEIQNSNGSKLNAPIWLIDETKSAGISVNLDAKIQTLVNSMENMNQIRSNLNGEVTSRKENQNYQPISNSENLKSQKDMFSLANAKVVLDKSKTQQSPFMVNTNPLPFYAGWDESLRKFVVTNRFLSRRDSGYSFIQNDTESAKINDKVNQTEEFTLAPLKGMNAPTILYWHIPFTTFDPDQYFVLGVDGFAPLNWRKFKFRHTLLKQWLATGNTDQGQNKTSTLITSKTSYKNSLTKYSTDSSRFKNSLDTNLLYKIEEKTSPSMIFGADPLRQKTLKEARYKYQYSQKRYQKLKGYSNKNVQFPSGPLANEVLPIHYISVFYKRSRLPRERYLKRKLNERSQGFSFPLNGYRMLHKDDMTLRKRVKPRRKYHKAVDLNKTMINFPRRFVGVSKLSETQRITWRPFSYRVLSLSPPVSNNFADYIKEQLKVSRLKKKTTRYFKTKEKASDSIRMRRLRRRVEKQTIRPTTKFIPRAGGIIWPGDYLQKTFVKAPSLQIRAANENASDENKTIQTRKIQRKKKRKVLMDWNDAQKKYLIKKHNTRVIKKKLAKAYRSNKIHQKIQIL